MKRRERTRRGLARRRCARAVEHLESRRLLASLRGQVFNDVDGDQSREPFLGEDPLPGWAVFADLNGNGVIDGETIEPDVYPFQGTLNDVLAGVTLSEADRQNQSSGDVTVKPDQLSSTGNLVFGNIFSFWQEDRRLRMDFANAASWVAIDFISSAEFTPMAGRLDVFDASQNLLDSYTTQDLLAGEVETMFLARAAADIAYAVAYVASGDFGRLDNLRFSSSSDSDEPMAVSDQDGNYSIDGLEAGTYRVAVVPRVTWFRTVPAAPEHHVVAVSEAGVATGVDFGNATLATSLTIRGAKWHDLNGDGSRGLGLNFQHEPGLSDWRVFVDVDRDGELDPGEPTTLTDRFGDYTLRVFQSGLHRVRALARDDWSQTWPQDDAAQVVQVNPTEPAVGIDVGSKIHGKAFVSGNILASRSTWGQEDLLIEYAPDAEVVQAFIAPNTAGFSRNLIQGVVTDDGGRVHLVMRTDSGNYLSTFDPATLSFFDTRVDEWDTKYTEGTDNNLAAFSHYLYANDQSLNGNANGIIRFDARDMSWTRFTQDIDNPYEIAIGLNGLLYTMEVGVSRTVVQVYDPESMERIRSIFLPPRQASLAVDAGGHIFTVTDTGPKHYDANGILVDSTISAGGGVSYLHPEGRLLYSGGSRLAILDKSFHPNTRVFFDELPGDLPADSYAAYYLPPVGLPLTVESVELNADRIDPADLPQGPQPAAWRTQHSDLRSIVVTFSQQVIASADDIVLVNLGVNAPQEADVRIPLEPHHVEVDGDRLTLRFGANELPDGVYQLYLLSSVTDLFGRELDGNGDGVAGDPFEHVGDRANGFYKLTADWNGDLGVSIFDFPALSYWFGQPVPQAPEYMDLNQDDGVSIFDFPQFAANFGEGVVFPPLPLAAAAAWDDQRTGEDPSADDTGAAVRDAALLAVVSRWRLDAELPWRWTVGIAAKRNPFTRS